MAKTKKSAAKKANKVTYIVSWDTYGMDPLKTFTDLESAKEYAGGLAAGIEDENGDEVKKGSVRVWKVEACYKVKATCILEEVE